MESRFAIKSYFQGILIFVSSVILPCAVMEYQEPEFTWVQIWIFPLGVYFQEWDISQLRSSRFFWLFENGYRFSYFSIIAVIWVAIGLILAAEVITLQGRKELTKRAAAIISLSLWLQIVVPIAVILLARIMFGWVTYTYIFPLPIPFLLAILLLKDEGIRFIRESYYQGFLVFVSSLMLPFAVVGFGTNNQNWLFPFGVLGLSFSEHLVRSGFLMPFFRRNWFPYFIIFAVVWVAIGLIFAAEVIKLWGGKKSTKKIFSISIILLALEIVGPIVAVLLMYGWTLAYISYIIPLPIPFLVAILLLRRSGVTLRPARKIGDP